MVDVSLNYCMYDAAQNGLMDEIVDWCNKHAPTATLMERSMFAPMIVQFDHSEEAIQFKLRFV